MTFHVALLSGLLLSAPATDPSGPRISSPSPTIEIGEVFQGEDKHAVFTIENSGDAPLGLLRVVPKCGCTVTKLRLPDSGEERTVPMVTGGEPFLSLQPGERCEILTTFLSAGQALGRLHKEIVIDSTDRDQPSFALTLIIDLKQIAWVEPKILQLGQVTHGDVVSGEVVIKPAAGAAFELAAVPATAGVDTMIERREDAAGGVEFIVRVTLRGDVPVGHFSRTLQIDTTLGEGRSVKIPVFAYVKSPISVATGNRFNASLLDFGSTSAGAPREASFELTNARPETPYQPGAITIDSEIAAQVATRVEALEPGVRYRVTVTVDGSVAARFFRGALKIASEHPEAASLEVQFRGWTKG